MKTLFLLLSLVIPLSLWSTFHSSKTVLQPYHRAVRTLYVATEDNIALVQRNDTTSIALDTKDDKRPLLILHVGPGKTGTTTVQSFAEKHAKLFQSDNFYYLEQERHELARLCKTNKQLEECNKKWAEFDTKVSHHYTEGHNLFVSEEGFSSAENSDMEQQHIWDRLVPLQKKWNVRVIYTYRRYYEWVPSKYAQGYNPKGPGGKRDDWPDVGGNVIPSFSKYFESKMTKDFKHPLAAKQRWDDHFSNVQVFNMHQDGEFLVNFYCQMIPEAAHVCDYLTNEYSSIVMNSSSKKVLHFDMIAVAAYKKGLVNKSLTRVYVRHAVEDFAKKLGLESAADFSQECLSQNLTKTLLSQSLSMESDMVPEYYSSPRGEKELKGGFSKAMDKGSFCSVDAEKVLQDKQWKEFFRKLGPM